MKAVIQRVSQASVTISGNVNGAISNGYMILLGISSNDNIEDLEWIIKKTLSLRIFNDELGKMNLDIKSVDGSILLISQFTLCASTKKGNRPSFIQAAKPDVAIPLYELFIAKIRERDIIIETGIFGADMKVSIINDGPVTIILDSKNKV